MGQDNLKNSPPPFQKSDFVPGVVREMVTAGIEPCTDCTGLEISARPLPQVSVETVGRVQITDHSPDLASAIIIS